MFEKSIEALQDSNQLRILNGLVVSIFNQILIDDQNFDYGFFLSFIYIYLFEFFTFIHSNHSVQIGNT